MFNTVSRNINWQGKKLTLETGKIARQADGAVMVKMCDTRILCTVTCAKDIKENANFLPLTVNYLERYYASGRYPGGFFKREAKPTDRETLIARLIDRPIRPLFPNGYCKEVSITCTVLSYDPDTQTDILSLIGAAAALNISSIPFKYSLAAVKIGEIEGDFVVNPTDNDLLKNSINLTMAGTSDSILMIESSAKEINEKRLLQAIEYAHNAIQPVVELLDDFTNKVSKETDLYQSIMPTSLIKEIKKNKHEDFVAAYSIQEKVARKNALQAIYDELYEQYSKINDFQSNLLDMSFKAVERAVVRSMILKDKKRIDGRGPNDVRAIECEIDVLPRAHGSALFTRGETQSIATVTLGSSVDKQMHDNMTGVTNDSFLLHYNFPPYSVGECGMLRPPSRRELGHGQLARKALEAVLPIEENFPYTVRVVSEITESNGSSSMATVCASSLALMTAGVPISHPVAGVAMGLILEKNEYVVISDILGDEDTLGDMDFKVAATAYGITALQMDIKIPGITLEIMTKAINQAKNNCMSILQKMNSILSSPKLDVSSSAPRLLTFKIHKDDIKNVIGPGGRVIKNICEKSQAKIDIENNGKLTIFAPTIGAMTIAKTMVNEIVGKPQVGELYTGKIVKIMEFGAFVRFCGSNDGLVHVSEILDTKVHKVEDCLKLHDTVRVKLMALDKRGRFQLSMKNIKQESLTPRDK